MNPNNAPQQQGGGSGGGCLGVVGVIVLVVAGIAALVGFLISGALGIIAPNRGMEPMQVSAIESLVEEPWTGQILCVDGEREVAVFFSRQRRAQEHISALVLWLSSPGMIDSAVGHYEAKGTFDGVRLVIEPEWGSARGSDYRSVALVGSVTDARGDIEQQTIELLTLSGSVAGDEDCSSFSLSR